MKTLVSRFVYVGVLVSCLSATSQAAPVLFSQTKFAPEQDVGGDGLADPFDFVFTPLDPVLAGETSFSLLLSFFDLDIDVPSVEFLTTLIDPSGSMYNLGSFPHTITGPNNNRSGTGTLVVPFASIGGLANFTDPFTVQLVPSNQVDFFTPVGGANLTLQYMADVPTGPGPQVPEPTSMALFGLTALGMGVVRRRRKQAADEVA